jgi:hypothetical protein
MKAAIKGVIIWNLIDVKYILWSSIWYSCNHTVSPIQALVRSEFKWVLYSVVCILSGVHILHPHLHNKYFHGILLVGILLVVFATQCIKSQSSVAIYVPMTIPTMAMLNFTPTK